jgi:aminoglycoside 6-adenylyltransferase
MRKAHEILSQLHDWAVENDHIRAMLLTSSRTNPHAFTDLFSDYDVELFVTDLQPFLRNDAWLETFGSILVCWPQRPVENDYWITRLVLYDDGVRIDFQISTQDSLAQLVNLPQLPPEYDNGYTILLDKDNLTPPLKPPSYTGYPILKPTEEEYVALMYDFWWDTTYVAKSLWRDELYFAKYMADHVIRFDYLQKLLEWYIGVRHDWSVNPNKHGRWFKRYLDPETWQELETTFAGAHIPDNWTALFNTTTLFRRLSLEIAHNLGYTYPADLDNRVTGYLLKVKNLAKHADDFA